MSEPNASDTPEESDDDSEKDEEKDKPCKAIDVWEPNPSAEQPSI